MPEKVKVTLSLDRETWYEFRAACQRRGARGGASAVLGRAMTAILETWAPGRPRRFGTPLFPAKVPAPLDSPDEWARWRQQLRDGNALENTIPAAIAAIVHELRTSET